MKMLNFPKPFAFTCSDAQATHQIVGMIIFRDGYFVERSNNRYVVAQRSDVDIR